jgi:hypothetical protein
MMGLDIKHFKHQDEDPTEKASTITESDHDSDKSQLAFQEIQEQQPCYSQGSFGGASQLSSAVGTLPKSQPTVEKESKPPNAATKAEEDEDLDEPCQEDVDHLTT